MCHQHSCEDPVLRSVLSVAELILLLSIASFSVLNRTGIPILVFSAIFLLLEAAALRWLRLVPVGTAQKHRKNIFVFVLLALVIIAIAFAMAQRT